MAEGRIVESGPSDRVLAGPAHPYTRELVGSAPRPATPEASAAAPPGQGCFFAASCSLATELCAREAPPVRSVAPGHVATCHRA
jgi:oligopeptide/dipeptide ABC transporter ATP-binding protein